MMSLQNLYFTSSDPVTAANFYITLFGATKRFEDSSRWVQMKLGDQNLALASHNEAPPQIPTGGAIPVFEVSDIAAFRRCLDELGGSYLGERDMGSHGHVVTASDPEGNVFQVIAFTTAAYTDG